MSEPLVKVGALSVPSNLAQWAEYVTIASQTHAVPESLVYAVMSRESEGGEAAGYTPKGAGGTGDWTARVGRWLKAEHVQVVEQLPPGWHPPRDRSGNIIPGPYAIPEDGLGWGRGLMQMDFEAALTFDWRDPAKNIDKGVALLALYIEQFPKNLRAGVASYNCGPKNVRQALLDRLDVDHFTAKQNYSADVFERRKSYEPAIGSSRGPA